MRTDSLFYEFFKTAPGIFFELIGHSATEADNYDFCSIEIKEPNFRIDGVFVPSSSSSAQTVYFVEVQFQPDRLLYHRLFAELFLYLDQNPTTRDWQAVVVYPRRSLEPNDSTLHRALLASPQVQRIYLDELAAVAEPSLGLGLVQLVVEREAQAANRARQLIEQSQQEAVAGLSRQEIIELIQTIMVYKFPQLGREAIETMLGLSELKQTRVYQEALQEGEATLVLRQLARRLGQLAPEVRSQIQQLPIEQLEELGEALLDFSSMQDLMDWLENHQG
ncbi:MAG: Rpn family recombination-promoting nuclease/putative transposase [Chroococcidiopsidaceae cyanobacterium CP_BM_RX_35]|nr:Rpn family recombination-promoting nuclease/putative transposase [Chroococcidiopsidaceae cyanobacterium CP_BM_RX_35]